jgi:hypothetical protein
LVEHCHHARFVFNIGLEQRSMWSRDRHNRGTHPEYGRGCQIVCVGGWFCDGTMMSDMMFVVMEETTGADVSDMVAVKSSSGLAERRAIWAVSSVRAVVSGLAVSGVLDGLFAKIDGGELVLTGDGGFVTELIKASVERGLVVELTDHLGYEEGRPGRWSVPQRRQRVDPGDAGNPGW